MRIFLPIVLACFSLGLFAQEEILPAGYSDSEKAMLEWIDFIEPATMGFATPEPPPEPVRHMAEWEELQALVVTWRSFPGILTEIVRHAQEEVTVIIACRNASTQASAENDLTNAGVPLDNVEFLVVDNNSVWVRDYGQNPVYANDMEDLYFIDWVYNRIQRPEDDVMPEAIGQLLDVPVYSTTEGDYRMVHTGGNFMSDGLGTAFSSKLIFEENEPGNIFGAGPHDEAAIDGIMSDFMGIDRYIKFDVLPYDGINHIDMHMHLVDEETILWGQYPEGVSDGPQIEANIAYLQENHMSAFGTPYRIERIIQPPDFNGTYPSQGGNYRTYTNSVFVNNTIIIPYYETQYDTIAQRIYEEKFPGYKVVGIECNDMIWALGALHCITKEVGAENPLWIVHKRQRDIDDNDTWGDYPISAELRHNQGIASAQLFWRTDMDDPYQMVEMTADMSAADTWNADIPHQENGTTIYYYIQGQANDGKTQVRPLAAPEGYYPFTVNDVVLDVLETSEMEFKPIYPNPASAITAIPLNVPQSVWANIEVVDVNGKLIETVFEGVLNAGENNKFIQAGEYLPGTYFVQVRTEENVLTQKLIVK